MKTIINHLSDVILSVAAVSLIIGVILAFGPTVENFAGNMVGKLNDTATNDDLWDKLTASGGSENGGSEDGGDGNEVGGETDNSGGSSDDTSATVTATNGLLYTLSNDGTYYICSGIGTATDTDIVIASKYNGLPVKEVGSYAFSECTSLTSIEIPSSVTFIGEYAFYNSVSFETITYEGTEADWSGVWIGLNWLAETAATSVQCSDALVSLTGTEGLEYAFSSDKSYYICTGIGTATDTDIVIGSIHGNGWSVVEVEKDAFKQNSTIKSVSIPYSVTTIGGSAFSQCKITSVTFAANSQLTVIDRTAFYNCYAISSLVIPDSVTTIGQSAFEACNGLYRLTIGSNVTNVNVGAFYGCTQLDNIVFNGPVFTWYTITLGNNWNLKVPATYVQCNDGKVYLVSTDTCEHSNTVVKNDVEATCGTAGYTGDIYCSDCKVQISSGSTIAATGKHSYGDYVKDYSNGTQTRTCSVCGATSTIALQATEGLQYTLSDDGTYYICSGIGTATDADIVIATKYNGLPVKEVGYSAFENCTSITSIFIPASVTTIDMSAFWYCTSLESVFFGENSQLTTLGSAVFWGCDTLESIILPAYVDKISAQAFKDCTSLTTIEIPVSVKTIGASAFNGCTNLTDVYYLGTEENWASINILVSNECLTDSTIHYKMSLK